MITEHYLAKHPRRRQDMKLPFAGHFEEREDQDEQLLQGCVTHKDRQLCKGKQAAGIGPGAQCVCLVAVL